MPNALHSQKQAVYAETGGMLASRRFLINFSLERWIDTKLPRRLIVRPLQNKKNIPKYESSYLLLRDEFYKNDMLKRTYLFFHSTPLVYGYDLYRSSLELINTTVSASQSL